MKWADYCISKLSLDAYGMIESVIICDDLGNSLGDFAERNRGWMVQEVFKGRTFCSITKTAIGQWKNIGMVSYANNLFSWYVVPKNLPRRKTFVSFYHHDDQTYREAFNNLFDDLIVSKSVEDGEIDSDNGDDYIKQLIQNDCLCDTTVLVVLIGPKTKCRKHVDWEISGALNLKVGDRYAGLLGIKLPNHPDFGTGKATYNLLPARFADNFKSGYAIIRDWTDDRIKMQSYIELAFGNREEKAEERDNSRIQMISNTCS